MADLDPTDQEAPGQPVVTAPTILTGARLNTSLDPIAGSRICVKPCECPQGFPRACTPNATDEQICLEPNIGESESFTFNGFDWQALDEQHLDECDGDNIVQNVAEVAASGAAYMIGRELDSAPLTGNPSLQEYAIDVAAGLVAHPADAVTMLMHASAKKGQYRSTFIGADHLLPTFLEASLVSQVNGQWRLAGRPIIFSPGISGLGPAGYDPGASGAYLYLVSGSVDYNFDPLSYSAIAAAERLNTQLALARASAIVRFNPLCVHAVAVCMAHESCCAGDAGVMLEAEKNGIGEPSPIVELAAARDAAQAKRAAVGEAMMAAEAKAVSEAKAVAEAKAVSEAKRAEVVTQLSGLPEIEPEPEPRIIEPEADQAPEIIEHDIVGDINPPVDAPIAEVLDWVQSDPDRAADALSAEYNGRNRVTLVAELDRIIIGDD